MLPVLRQTLSNTPLTVSVSGSDGTTGLRRLQAQLSTVQPDYYDYHFYAASERALPILKEARGIVAPATLVIGEVGLSTVGNTDDDPAAYLARVFTAAGDAGITSVAPWILSDFLGGAIPAGSAVAGSPQQYQYGLFRVDGSAKSAAGVVHNAWTGGPVNESLLNLGFEGRNGLSPWRAYLPDLGVGVQSTIMAHSGTSSAMFTRTGRTSSGMPSVRLSPITSVRSGQTWRVQVWARGTAVTGTNQLSLSWFDAANRYLDQTSSPPLATGNTGWTLLTAQGPAPANAATVEIHLKSGNNSGTVWYDDVTITQ
jgi:hypothetical protein